MSKLVTNTKEWLVDMPWGKVAMISWGHSTNPAVLMVHGYVDSAATFTPLIKELPEDYYYVAFDMPGHGRSDPFPAGLVVSQLNIVEVIRRVVDSMKWEKVICIAHSMGAIISLFYNYVCPGRISAMVLLDPGPGLNFYYFVNYEHNVWYQYVYEQYYKDYQRYNSSKKKLYSYEDAVTLTAGNRNLTVEQAKVILSRSLEAEGENYSFSMDPRMKYLSNIPVAEDTIRKVIVSNILPTLILVASIDNSIEPAKSFALNILQDCTGSKNYNHIEVTGGHDFHITNPSATATHVKKFLADINCYAKNMPCKI